MSSVNNPNLELISLIWLDVWSDATQENREVQVKLRSVVNYLRTFDNCKDCKDYIEEKIHDKIILIVSGQFSQNIIGNIHDLRQIISIFIFCGNQQKYQSLTKDFNKIRGVIVELDDLLKEIDLDRKSEEHKLNESIQVLTNKDEIIPMLLEIDSTLIDKRHLLNICSKEYEGNLSELENVDEFEHLYYSSNALKWFFDETFLYRLLIKSLDVFNIDLLFLLRFFLRDIDEQLKVCSTVSVPVYRGQLMTIDQIDFLNQSIGKDFIRFNSFIIGNRNEEEIIKCLQNSPNRNGFHRVLFEIDINHIGKEYNEKILFPLITYFRINSIYFEKRIWIVKLNVLNCNQYQNKKDITSIQLAHHLRNLGQFDQSEKLFNRLLSQHPSLNPECYDGLGRIAQDKGLYQMSLNFYKKSLDGISSRKRAHCLNNVGCAYDYLEQYEKALKYYSKSLTLITSDLNQSISLNNIGITYAKNEQYQDALQCFQQSLDIRNKLLSETNPDLGITHTNIGVLWSSLDQTDVALEHYQKALQIFSVNNLNIFKVIVYQNMAQIFQDKNQYDRALTFYQDAETIFRQFRSCDHPNIIQLQIKIEQLKQKKEFIF